MSQEHDVAAFIWPAYTGDEPRTRMFWPEGIGEWESVRKAEKKFPEHSWPRKPLWGYVNEADPRVMEMQIDAAADHGINTFIYDWYWYDRRPFLETCLNNGYLQARNNDRVKFYLMWANHDVRHIWDKRLAGSQPENIIWRADVDRPEFEKIANRLIDRYFEHPSYYRINGRPVFMIFHLQKLIEGFGGPEATREALNWWRERAIRAGLDGLHLQLCLRKRNGNITGLGGTTQTTQSEMVDYLKFDSISHYQFVHITDVNRDYNDIVADVIREWERIDDEYSVPYFPHVSVGWDNNPRFQELRPRIVKNNTPEKVQNALKKAREYADAHPQQTALITVNSWNEWTETSYLQPDDLYGYGYLEAVKKVFG